MLNPVGSATPILPCEGTGIWNVIGLADDRNFIPERAQDHRARGADLKAGGDPQDCAENREGQG